MQRPCHTVMKVSRDDVASRQIGLPTTGWRAFCRSKTGLLHRVGAIAAYQIRPSGYESAPRPRSLLYCVVRVRSLAACSTGTPRWTLHECRRACWGGENAEPIEFMHLLRFSNFIMRRCSVNRTCRAERTATPRLQSALARRTRALVGPARAASANPWIPFDARSNYFRSGAMESLSGAAV